MQNNLCAHSTLPSRLQVLLKDVEALAKAPVRWEYRADIGGAMCALIEAGTPIIRYRERSEAGIAEELMHLRLVLSGVELSYPANRHLVGQTATMLQNVVHHQVIFPVLADWGYQPSITECGGISKQLSMLENSDLERARTEPDLVALLAIVYVRIQLDCGSPDVMSRLEKLFSMAALEYAREIGIHVISVIRKQIDSSPAACRETLVDCLNVLGLSSIVAVASIHA